MDEKCSQILTPFMMHLQAGFGSQLSHGAAPLSLSAPRVLNGFCVIAWK